MTIARAKPRTWHFDLVDDWLKKDRFVFVGSGLLLFPLHI
jgi:hypothetical protein